MVTVPDHEQRGSIIEAVNHLSKQANFGERIAVTRYEEHWHLNVRKMVRSPARRSSGRVQGETQEDQAANAGDWRKGLGLGGHPASVGTTSGKQGQVAGKFFGGRGGCTDGRVSDSRRVRSASASLHIWKLIAKGRDSSIR